MKDKQKILEIMNLRFKDKLTYKEIAKEYGATEYKIKKLIKENLHQNINL